MLKKLQSVTLLGIDCIDLERLKQAVEICQKEFSFAETKILSSLPGKDGDSVIKIDPINSLEEYSRFIIFELDKYVDTDYVLIVQYDGFILNPQAWDDRYLDYDYIGAPWLVADWSVKNFNFPADLQGKHVVGNGGFSLRSKRLLSLTAQLAREGKFSRYSPEDVAIGVYYKDLLAENNIKIAPVDLAQKFSFESETSENYSWDGQFGFHGLKWTDISKWTKIHPEYQIDNPATKKSERLKYL